MELYLMVQLNQGCNYADKEGMDRLLAKFYTEFEIAIDDGLVRKISPVQFILNMVSLISFPIGMRPLFQRTMQITDKEYEQVLFDRRNIIMDTLFA